MIRKLGLFGAVSALALAVAGCGDDALPRVVTITGIAAMGAPIHLGEVRAEGANGVQSDIDITDSHGRFEIKGIGMTAPITIRVKNGKYDHDNDSLTPASTAPDLLSLVHSANGGAVNVTPLTTLALQQATGIAGRAALYTALTNPTTAPTADELAEAAAIVRANLATVAATAGVTNWTDYNLFTAPFTADGTGFDAILDAVSCRDDATTDGFQVICSGAISTFDPNIDISAYYEPGSTGGGGGGGGGSGTITVSNATPTSGNGSKALTDATVSVDGSLTRVQMEGNDFMVKVYYTSTTGAVTNVSYLWGNVNFTTGLADNVAFCAGTCGTVVNTVADTVTFTNSSLTSDSNAATLNGTVSGLSLTDIAGGSGGGGCTGAACQMTATYTVTFSVPGTLPEQTQTFSETVTGSVAGLNVTAIRTSIENEYDAATNISVSTTLDTPTHKTFRITFKSPMDGVPLTADYVVTYDYVQL